jgi:hypothetical protein
MVEKRGTVGRSPAPVVPCVVPVPAIVGIHSDDHSQECETRRLMNDWRALGRAKHLYLDNQ